MIFKFGKKLNELVEAQLQPEYGEPSNPFDLFEGKLFAVQVRKVGEWNNYDLCSFVGDKCPIQVNGKPMKKNQDDMNTILEYLNEGPKNLTSFDYKDWDDDMTEKIMGVIKNTVPEARIINEIIGGVTTAPTKSASSSAPSNSSNDIYAEAAQTKVGSTKREEPPQTEAPSRPNTSSTSSSLEDLYNDL